MCAGRRQRVDYSAYTQQQCFRLARAGMIEGPQLTVVVPLSLVERAHGGSRFSFLLALHVELIARSMVSTGGRGKKGERILVCCLSFYFVI